MTFSMRTRTGQQAIRDFRKFLPYWSPPIALFSLMGLMVSPWSIVAFVAAITHMFWGNLGLVKTFGPLYWGTNVDRRILSIGKSTMHQTSSPWRKGQGVYVALFHRHAYIGWARKQDMDEIEGTLSAIQGRYLDLEPKEIGKW